MRVTSCGVWLSWRFWYKWVLAFMNFTAPYWSKTLRYLNLVLELSQNLNNQYLRGCLWKERTHTRTKTGDSVLTSLFICSSVVCESDRNICTTVKYEETLYGRHLALNTSCSHYENTPIQIHRKFHLQKLKKIQIKNYDIFHYSAQNIDCGYSLEPPPRGGSNEYPQSMFWAEVRKLMFTPVNPVLLYKSGV